MKTIAFCVPVMNREEDIKETLRHNLEVINSFHGRAKLYINCFDADDRVWDFVNREFRAALDASILVYNKVPPLSHWHFSRAKNSFADFIAEDYYSSLDGDNFLSMDKLETLFELIDRYDDVVYHGFSGQYGDGTSGQVTLPRQMYLRYRYLDEIYPRQYDEMGLIARVLTSEQDVVFACYEGADVTNRSGAFRQALTFAPLRTKKVFLKAPEGKRPLNPKGNGYVKKDALLSYYQAFNSNYTFLRAIKDPDATAFHRAEMFGALSKLDESILADVLGKSFSKGGADAVKSSSLTVYSVIKNDRVFLKKWSEHYRSLGVERFIIVDDHSTEDISADLSAEDVFLYQPLIGDFKNCKVYWMQLLMKAFQTEGSWALTVDSDEFLTLGAGKQTLSSYCTLLDGAKRNFAAGILVDMLPGQGFEIDDFNGENFTEAFDRFYLRPPREDINYKDINAVRWGFRGYWEYSYRLDCRWRFFGTVDSLRKFPLFRYVKDVELNQGFHALKMNGKNVSATEAFENPTFVLPIKHYKFVGFFLDNGKCKDLSAYHERTEENLKKIGARSRVTMSKEIAISPFVRRFDLESFSSIFFNAVGLYRIIGNELPGLHSDDQSLENLQFILDREPQLPGVDKYFVLNRIVDEEKSSAIRDLLRRHGYRFMELAFDAAEYSKIGYDDCEAELRVFKPAERFSKWETLCAEVAKRESRNRYLMNNNGARNAALAHGRERYTWVMPWDGNCFLSLPHFHEIKEAMESNDGLKYIVTPMERVVDNDSVSAESVSQNAVEEPQICFHKTSNEKFSETRVYGNQPKVELFKRLKIPGIWDQWVNLYPWKKLTLQVSNDAGTHKFAGAVFRLASGNKDATVDTKNRTHARAQAIIEFIDEVHGRASVLGRYQ